VFIQTSWREKSARENQFMNDFGATHSLRLYLFSKLEWDFDSSWKVTLHKKPSLALFTHSNGVKNKHMIFQHSRQVAVWEARASGKQSANRWKRRGIKISRFNYAKLLTAQLQNIFSIFKKALQAEVFATMEKSRNTFRKRKCLYIAGVWIKIFKVEVLNSSSRRMKNAKFRRWFCRFHRSMNENPVKYVLHKIKKQDFVQIFELLEAWKCFREFRTFPCRALCCERSFVSSLGVGKGMIHDAGCFIEGDCLWAWVLSLQDPLAWVLSLQDPLAWVLMLQDSPAWVLSLHDLLAGVFLSSNYESCWFQDASNLLAMFFGLTVSLLNGMSSNLAEDTSDWWHVARFIRIVWVDFNRQVSSPRLPLPIEDSRISSFITCKIPHEFSKIWADFKQKRLKKSQDSRNLLRLKNSHNPSP
jgi:hypothetical protein